MKKTQAKDNLRNIRKQWVSFLSIVVIALLGVAVYLGIGYSVTALKRNGSDAYVQQNFRDIEIISTLLLTPEDGDAIAAAEGVTDMEPVWQTSAKVRSGEAQHHAAVISATERINQPVIVAGRMPQNATECAVEQRLAQQLDWKVGDSVTVEDAAGGIPQYLRSGSYVVTGIVDHPDHTCLSVPDTLYVIVTPDAFDSDALDGCFMKAEIVTDKDPALNRFDPAYTAAAEAVQQHLEDLAQQRAPARAAAVRSQVEETVGEYRTQLAEGKAQLESSRAELDDGWAALSDGEKQLAEGRAQLDAFKKQLDSAKAQLSDGEKQLADAEAELSAGRGALRRGRQEVEAAKAQLDAGKTELTDGWEQLEDAKGQIRDAIRQTVETYYGGDTSGEIAWAGRMPADVDNKNATAMDLWITQDHKADLKLSLAENIHAYVYSDEITDEMLQSMYDLRTADMAVKPPYDADAERAILEAALVAAAATYEDDYNSLQGACRQWDEGHAAYMDGVSQYEAGLAQYQAGAEELSSGRAQYEAGLARYQENLALYNSGVARYQKGMADYEAGLKKLAESREQLEAGEKEYAEGLAAWQEGEAQLAAAQKQVEDIDDCRWLVLDDNGNVGFMQLIIGSQNLSGLKGTFALMFILVGALVIFATVSKMVDEQRTLVGTTKAVGFFNGEIFAKYLLFGVSATVLGVVLGAVAARFGMEPIALSGYDRYYTLDLAPAVVEPVSTLTVLVAGVAVAALAVWVACSRLLRTPAIRLMQAAVPQGTKKAAGGSRSGSLYTRLILLNMRSDWRRVLVTIVSVAGCCALVVIGFTLQYAVSGTLRHQYGEIVAYDECVKFDPETNGDAQQTIAGLLHAAGASYALLYDADITYQLSGLETGELLCGDIDEIGTFYHLNDWKTGQPIAAADDGIFIQRRVAEMGRMDVGDTPEIAIGGTQTAAVTVAGIYENFIGRAMVMSPVYYETVFGEKCTPNAFYVRYDSADGEALNKALRQVDGFESTVSADSDRAMFATATSVISSLVLLFIFMAAIMAGVVLMNLTNMYILQKKRELTIMRVNGFSTGEVISYVTRETILTTAAGILLGFALGSGVAYRIVRSMEQSFVQYDRSISFIAWALAAVITVVFTVLVNVVALRPVKHLKLTDVA